MSADTLSHLQGQKLTEQINQAQKEADNKAWQNQITQGAAATGYAVSITHPFNKLCEKLKSAFIAGSEWRAAKELEDKKKEAKIITVTVFDVLNNWANETGRETIPRKDFFKIAQQVRTAINNI